MIHPNDRPLQLQVWSEALQGSRDYEVEYRIVRPDGDIRFVHARDEIVYDKSGKPIRVFGVIQDITERKHAEERLRLSEERYRNLFDHLPIPAFTKDINGIYTSSNEENLKYWATNPIGHTDAELYRTKLPQRCGL